MDKMYVAREDVKAVQDVSEREMEVLLLIARGMIPREIARSLAIRRRPCATISAASIARSASMIALRSWSTP